MMITFHEYLRMRETAGDSWGSPPTAPTPMMLGPNAPIPGNLTGASPPGPGEQYDKLPKRRKTRKEIREQPYDNPNLVKRNRDRAKEFGVNP